MKMPDAWVMRPVVTKNEIKFETSEMTLCKSCIYHDEDYCKLHGMKMGNNDYCSDARRIDGGK